MAGFVAVAVRCRWSLRRRHLSASGKLIGFGRGLGCCLRVPGRRAGRLGRTAILSCWGGLVAVAALRRRVAATVAGGVVLLDLVAGGCDCVPLGAEGVESFAVGLSFSGVLDEGVER